MYYTATDIILGILTFVFIMRFGLFFGLFACFSVLVVFVITLSIVSSWAKR